MIKRTKIVLSIGLVVAAVLCIPLVYLLLSLVPPKVSVTCTTDSDGRLVIHVQKNFRVNGTGHVMVWLEDREDLLWHIRPGTDEFAKITYGIIPFGADQLFPAAPASPKEIPPGAIFHIDVDYTFDWLILPSGGHQTYAFQMSEDGVAEPVD